jgi:signal transduction histidine kinase
VTADWQPDSSGFRLPQLSRVRLDELLHELLDRVGVVLATQDRLHALLDAVVSISSDLDLRSVLERIVAAACRLAGARYGALGVIGPDRHLIEFITYGISAEQRGLIGPPPRGHGILGLLIEDAKPLRLRELGEHPRSYGFPPNHPPMSSFLGVPVRVREQVFGNLYLTEKEAGEEFTDEDEQIVVALAAAAGVTVDNARLYAQAGRRQRWLEATAEITSTLLGDVDRSVALQFVARRAREVAGADLAVILLPADSVDALVVEVADGPGAAALRGVRVPRQGSLAGEVAKSDHSLASDDLRKDGQAWQPENGWPDEWPALGPAVMVPLGSPSGGVLAVACAQDSERRFTSEDVGLVEAFAGQAALALDRARARADRERLAVFEDRDRIARDLHDLVIQRVFAVGLQLQGLARVAQSPRVAERLTAVVADLDATIRDIRSTIFALHHGGEGTTFKDAIAAVIDDATATLGFRPRLDLVGPIESAIPVAVRGHVLAVLREALSNIARHANAAHVEVRLSADRHVLVEVRDDGRGMGGAIRESGLRNLRERAESAGGSFQIQPAQPNGTLLQWRAPLTR